MNKKMQWRYEPLTNTFYYMEGKNKFLIKKFMIYANGIRDSCISLKDGQPVISKIVNTSKEKILAIPDGDIAIVELDRQKDPVIIFDVNPSTKPMVDFLVAHCPKREQREDFAMYGGDIYG